MTASSSQLELDREGENNADDEYYDEEYEISQGHIEIKKLKNQREELREVISKVTSQQTIENKINQEKIKVLEAKLHKANLINEKLSKRNGAQFESLQSASASASSSSLILNPSKGGKLQGFNVVSPTKKLFDN